MTIGQFQLLTDDQKDEVVCSDGIFLANYDEDNDMCDIYQLFDFYVAFCCKLDEDKDAEIVAHINADELPKPGDQQVAQKLSTCHYLQPIFCAHHITKNRGICHTPALFFSNDY